VTTSAAPAAAPVPGASHVPGGSGRPPGDSDGRASSEAWHKPFERLLLHRRRAAGSVLLVALLVAVISWYFGADVSHSVLIGTAVGLGVVGVYGSEGLDLKSTGWRGGGGSSGAGARGDVVELSWSLRKRYGRVGDPAVSRVQQIARQRLALHGLDLSDPADRREIERLVGSNTCALLVPDGRRAPSLRSLLHCLDVLDVLDARRPTVPPLRPRRRWLILSLQHSRSARER
jgi:hypothetical protein